MGYLSSSSLFFMGHEASIISFSLSFVWTWLVHLFFSFPSWTLAWYLFLFLLFFHYIYFFRARIMNREESWHRDGVCGMDGWVKCTDSWSRSWHVYVGEKMGITSRVGVSVDVCDLDQESMKVSSMGHSVWQRSNWS
jgi:hypothetical protein